MEIDRYRVWKVRFNEPLRVGQRATGTVDGVEVVVLLSDILTTVKAQGEIVGIFDGQNEKDVFDRSFGDNQQIKP